MAGNNADWWEEQILANVRRDRDTDEQMAAADWRVVRMWEHEEPDMAGGWPMGEWVAGLDERGLAPEDPSSAWPESRTELP